MDKDSITLDIPELDEIPTIELDGLGSLDSIENGSIDSSSEEVDNSAISKIHEYLDKDLEDQDLLIEKLKAFEKKLDDHINGHKTHRT
ncbi:hypothetical protein EHEL_060355 [Encephalitozoon hellem ATCC 50504]|uniref:Uncharacterized protein n=1 Tax=Encephalitozoon hellem TaxID=27973 RepID=A0A9Q9C391_ENCHE|nr:uncharacterized protein EHEL_060355 [Encephalitozoon hellem ATCC 50504]AHL28937.1 hypothetical protein EHEL_060355 [Encephalitozoon hellem ATCC 50504]UTX43331.1 hypothetical protein GPU96_06g10780 [Encephalitozoon hellem]WEL38793.1 hypothetical protein PFJ87_06g00590 [Encephalitozoon hellem]